MAKQMAEPGTKLGPIARVREFYDEVMTEMAKVTWPSKDELKASTSVVMFLLCVVAAIIYAYDVAFQFLVRLLFKLG